MSKKELEQPYCKDNNVLQLSLFYFGKDRREYTVAEWETLENSEVVSCKLQCDCKYGVPGALEQDIYTSVMRKWVEQGMPDDAVELSYSDIAKILGIDPKSNVTRIKKALKKLAQARYELTRCFLQVDSMGNKPKRISTHFSLFDSASLFDYHKGKSKKKSMSKIFFPKEIRKNLESKYYQMLDMKWYKKLPSGLTRRLYEYLEKRKYQSKNGVFAIREKLLSQWLPIKDSKLSRRESSIKKYANNLINAGFLESYKYDKDKSVCRFIYATVKIARKNEKPDNKLNDSLVDTLLKKQNATCQVEFVEALDWLSSIPYFQKKKRNEIAGLPMEHIVILYKPIKEEYVKTIEAGVHLRPSWVYNKFTEGVKNISSTLSESVLQDIPCQMDFYENSNKVDELYKLLKKDTKELRKKIIKAVDKYGHEHVKNNILYTNKNVKKSYSSYLLRSIENSWGNTWAEEKESCIKEQGFIEKQEKIEEQERLAEEKHKKELEKNLKEERAKFAKAIKNTPPMVRKLFFEKAESLVPTESIGRSLNVKIEYIELLFKSFNECKKVFSEKVKSDLNFIKEIAEI